MLVRTDLIIPNPEQPRHEFDQAALAELAESIRLHGLISLEDAGDHYILIDGERRWRAAQMAGLEMIEASVRPGMNGTGQIERLVLATVANIQRADMNPVDKAQAFKKLMAAGLSKKEVVKVTGLSLASIDNYLLILRLPKEIQALVGSGKLPTGARAIRALLDISDQVNQYAIARAAASKELSEIGVVALARRMQQGKQAGRRAKENAKSRSELSATWAGKWNMIAQAGNPHIADELRKAALTTCKNCPLFMDASPKMCRDCPAVELFKRISEVMK